MIQAFIAAHKLGWKPQVYVASISIEPTVMAIATLSTEREGAARDLDRVVKDPNDPLWARDPALRPLPDGDARHYPSGKPSRRLQLARDDVRLDDGRRAREGGPEPHPRRPAARGDAPGQRDNPFVLPGVTLQTTPTSYYPIAKAQLYRYRGGRWQPFSGLLGARG